MHLEIITFIDGISQEEYNDMGYDAIAPYNTAYAQKPDADEWQRKSVTGESFSGAILPQDTVKTRVNDAVVWYIENLNFNAEYSNMGLVKHIASLDGVVIAELKSSKRKVFGSALDFSEINAKCIPDAGYMRAYNSDDIQLNMIVHDSYEMTSE